MSQLLCELVRLRALRLHPDIVHERACMQTGPIETCLRLNAFAREMKGMRLRVARQQPNPAARPQFATTQPAQHRML
eukprot:6012315-Pleurochrysis_carterae.AAC.1